jgi:DNA-binding transcriptional regulator LsrR (DeoR family)
MKNKKNIELENNSSNTEMVESVSNKITKLKIWLMENSITQKAISENTSLSTNTINRLVNEGTASKSVRNHVALYLGISDDELTKLLKFRKPNS